MKVITCFSYKGGSGRTVAAANIAAALASEQKVAFIEEPLNFKVALFDLDVFSAGTHRVFEIPSKGIMRLAYCVQDYLLHQIPPGDFLKENAITLAHDLMTSFKEIRNAGDNCRTDFTFFPSKPEPDKHFVVAKYHENSLMELILELEREGYQYVILDGESGARSMANIAVRLSDIVLMFFRLTWQHVDGTLETAAAKQKKNEFADFYLIPTCVPLVGENDSIYMNEAPGLVELRDMTQHIPEVSGINDFARQFEKDAGHFWANKICIHESLTLKGGERVLVYDAKLEEDQAANDYYRIAAELSQRHPSE